jgi:hypothetical protein
MSGRKRVKEEDMTEIIPHCLKKKKEESIITGR